MKFYKEKLSRRVRWPIGVICFSLVYGQAYAQPLTLDTALKLAEQYAPTLRVNSAQIEGAENVVVPVPVEVAVAINVYSNPASMAGRVYATALLLVVCVTPVTVPLGKAAIVMVVLIAPPLLFCAK